VEIPPIQTALHRIKLTPSPRQIDPLISRQTDPSVLLFTELFLAGCFA